MDKTGKELHLAAQYMNDIRHELGGVFDETDENGIRIDRLDQIRQTDHKIGQEWRYGAIDNKMEVQDEVRLF